MVGILGTVLHTQVLAYVGYNIKLYCYSTSIPEWSRKINDMEYYVDTKPTVAIDYVSDEDAGEYICKGTDKHGSFSASCTVYVAGKLFSLIF